MFQPICAGLVLFVVFPLLVRVLPGLFGLGWGVWRALALAGCAYASAFVSLAFDSAFLNAMHSFENALYVCHSAAFIVFFVLNGIAVRLIFKASIGRSIALGSLTAVLLIVAGVGSLLVLFQGVSFC